MAKRRVRIQHANIVRLFAARLREVRLSRGLTQAELAHRAHVTPTYIGKLENATTAPGIDLVARIAAALGTSVADLLPETEQPDPVPGLKEKLQKLVETLKSADRETLSLLVPLLARLLESPPRRR